MILRIFVSKNKRKINMQFAMEIMTETGTRKRFRRPATAAPSISNDQEVSASVNRFKVTRNRISNKSKKNEIQTDKSEDYKVIMIIIVTCNVQIKNFTTYYKIYILYLIRNFYFHSVPN